MNISDASKLSGLPVKTLRYYEQKGLVEAARSDNGYREYSDVQIRDLVFLRRARQFSFSLEECEQLLKFFRSPDRESHEVHQLAEQKLAQMNRHIEEICLLRDHLQVLLADCANDGKPDCAIINSLSGEVTDDNVL